MLNLGFPKLFQPLGSPRDGLAAEIGKPCVREVTNAPPLETNENSTDYVQIVCLGERRNVRTDQ